MKQRRILIAQLIVLAMLIFFGACRKQLVPLLASTKFAGNFNGSETCILSGGQTGSLHIVATGATQVSIANLYGLPGTVNGNVSNDSCIILPQLNNKYIVQGLLILSGDTITLSVIASSFGRRDKCSAILLKQ